MDNTAINTQTREKSQLEKKRQNIAFILMGLGAFLGFISCVLTISNPFPEFFYHILYGLTSLALLVIFAGLYFLFE